MGEAFKPLGVNLKFWELKLQTGAKQSLTVVLTNDTDKQLTEIFTLCSGQCRLQHKGWKRSRARRNPETVAPTLRSMFRH